MRRKYSFVNSHGHTFVISINDNDERLVVTSDPNTFVLQDFFYDDVLQLTLLQNQDTEPDFILNKNTSLESLKEIAETL